jgi:hypothetical protein
MLAGILTVLAYLVVQRYHETQPSLQLPPTASGQPVPSTVRDEFVAAVPYNPSGQVAGVYRNNRQPSPAYTTRNVPPLTIVPQLMVDQFQVDACLNNKAATSGALPVLPMHLDPFQVEDKSRSPKACDITPLKTPSRFYAGWTIAPVWIWQGSQSSVRSAGYLPAFTEQGGRVAKGLETGVVIGYRLSPNWSFETGLQRRVVRQELFHSATLKLMDGICLNPNDPGIKNYEFQYALQSRAGDTEVKVNISQADSTSHMAADQPFTLNMKTTRENVDWIIPLAIRRSFGSGRLKGFLRAGLSLEIPGSTRIQVEHYSEACIDLCFASGHIPSITATRPAILFLQYQISSGFTWYCTKRLGLVIEPTLFGRPGMTGFSSNASIFYRF